MTQLNMSQPLHCLRNLIFRPGLARSFFLAQSSPAHFPAGIPGKANFVDVTLAGFTLTFSKIKEFQTGPLWNKVITSTSK